MFKVEGTNDTLIMWVLGSGAVVADQLGEQDILQEAGNLLRFVH